MITTDNISTWTFNASGYLDTYEDNEKTILSKDDYFVPIPSLTQITEDKLVIAIEGTSLKENLPEIRGGSEVPFYFQIIDKEEDAGKYTILRQRF